MNSQILGNQCVKLYINYVEQIRTVVLCVEGTATENGQYKGQGRCSH